MSLSATVRTLGKKVNNYIEDATDKAAGNLKWTDEKNQEWTVPTGKRWLLLYGNVHRDVASTLTIRILDSSDQVLTWLYNGGAGTDEAPFPNTMTTGYVCNPAHPIIMDEAEYVKVVLGTNQGAGATASCVVVEVDV